MPNNVAEIVIRAKDEATPTINTLGSRLSGLMNNQFVQGTLAITGFNLGLDAAKTAISGVIGEASKLENAIADFTTLTGSVDDARKMVDQLRQLGTQTPFEFLDLSQATKTLLGFGAATKDDLIPTLKMLGDTAGGNAERLNSVVLAFSQIKAGGKASMQDINQLINAGVPIIGELAKGFGVSVAEMRKMVEQGKATSDEVTKAFQRMTSEGGLFYGSMERASQTLSGRFSTFVDETKMMSAAIGTQLLPAIGGILDASSSAISALGKLFDSKPIKLWVAILNEAVLGIVYVFGKSFSNLAYEFQVYLNNIKDGFAWLYKWGDDWKKYKLQSDADMAKLADDDAKNSLKRDQDYFKRHTDIWNNYKGIRISNNDDIKKSHEKTNESIINHTDSSGKKIIDNTKKQAQEYAKQWIEANEKIENETDRRRKESEKNERDYQKKKAELLNESTQDIINNEKIVRDEIENTLKQRSDDEIRHQELVDEIYKNGYASKKAMAMQFVDDKKELIQILADFEGNKEERITEWVKKEIEKRVIQYAMETATRIAEEVFAQTKIQEIRAGAEAANAATSGAGSLLGGATNVIGSIVSGAGSLLGGAANVAGSILSGAGGVISGAGGAVSGVGGALSAIGSAVLPVAAVGAFLNFAQTKSTGSTQAAEDKKNQETFQKNQEEAARKQAESDAFYANRITESEKNRKIAYEKYSKEYTSIVSDGISESEVMRVNELKSKFNEMGMQAPTIQVNVQLDKQTLGRAIVDLQRQQNAGVL